MTIKVYKELLQGTDEWYNLRLGIVTASQVNLILTPTFKVSNNDKVRDYAYELVAQQVYGHLEDTYQSFHMERGGFEEGIAKSYYSDAFFPVEDCGFITNEFEGRIIGFSPDGLIGDDGLIEVKSRMQKFQIKTIVENKMPDDYVLQVQTALMVSERKWCDFIQYSNGKPLFVKRILTDLEMQEKIKQGVLGFYQKVDKLKETYLQNSKSLILTERKNYNENQITIGGNDD